mgnify:CR=1 FL=1
MRLLSEKDLYNKKIIIINNLSNSKLNFKISSKLKNLNSNYLVIFLKEYGISRIL